MAEVHSIRTYKTVKRQLIDNGDGTHSVPLASGGFALIDSGMAEAVARFSWCLNGYGYARTVIYTPMKADVLLHHLVAGKPLGKLQIDHANRNRLDNRKCNLRVVSSRGNSGNKKNKSKTGYVGVYRGKNRFSAMIRINGKLVHLGSRDTPEEAARLYDACLRVLGEKVSLGNGSIVTSLRDLTSIQVAFDRNGVGRRG